MTRPTNAPVSAAATIPAAIRLAIHSAARLARTPVAFVSDFMLLTPFGPARTLLREAATSGALYHGVGAQTPESSRALQWWRRWLDSAVTLRRRLGGTGGPRWWG